MRCQNIKPAFLMGKLACLAGTEAAQGPVYLGHLGDGASLAAVHGGKSMDTRMSFTRRAGVAMSTRSGTNEEWMIANMACRVLDLAIGKWHDRENQLNG